MTENQSNLQRKPTIRELIREIQLLGRYRQRAEVSTGDRLTRAIAEGKANYHGEILDGMLERAGLIVRVTPRG